MTKKGNLFNLIKTLSKSEKRYIKISLKTEKDASNYLLLFNYIDSNTNITDSSIRAEFQNKTFIKQLHVTKNYLIKIILKLLKNFHQKTNHQIELLNNILEIELLFKKEQFDLAEFYVNKTINQAQKYQSHTILYSALNLKRKIIQERFGLTEAKEQINQILKKQNAILEELQNINEYFSLNSNFFEFFKPTSQFAKKNYTELAKHPLLQNPTSATSIEAKILYFYLHFQLSVYQDKNFEEAAHNIQQILQLLEKEPAYLQENTSIYINNANQLINLYLYTKNYLVVPDLLQKIRHLPERYKLKTSHPETLKGLLQSYLYELELYKHTGQTRLALNLIKHIEEFIKTHNYPITKKLLPQFLFLFAYFNFYHQNYQKALLYIKKLLKTPNHAATLTKEKILGYFLELFTYCEQNRRLDLNKSLHQHKVTIKAERRLNTDEKLLFTFLEEVQKNQKPYSELLAQLGEYLSHNQQPENESELINELNLNKWINKKLTTD